MDQLESYITLLQDYDINYQQIYNDLKKLDEEKFNTVYKNLCIFMEKFSYVNELCEKIEEDKDHISIDSIISILLDSLSMPQGIIYIIFDYAFVTKYISNKGYETYAINKNIAVSINSHSKHIYNYLVISDILKHNIIKRSRELILFNIKYEHDSLVTFIFFKDDDHVCVYVEICKKEDVLNECYLLTVNIKNNHIEKLDFYEDNMLEYYRCSAKYKIGHIYHYNNFLYVCSYSTIYEIDLKKNKFTGNQVSLNINKGRTCKDAEENKYMYNVIFINDLLFITKNYEAKTNTELKIYEILKYQLQNFSEDKKEIIVIDISLKKLNNNKRRVINSIEVSSSIFCDNNEYNLLIYYRTYYDLTNKAMHKYRKKHQKRKYLNELDYMAIFNMNLDKITMCKKCSDISDFVTDDISYSNAYKISNTDNYIVNNKDDTFTLTTVVDYPKIITK